MGFGTSEFRMRAWVTGSSPSGGCCGTRWGDQRQRGRRAPSGGRGASGRPIRSRRSGSDGEKCAAQSAWANARGSSATRGRCRFVRINAENVLQYWDEQEQFAMVPSAPKGSIRLAGLKGNCITTLPVSGRGLAPLPTPYAFAVLVEARAWRGGFGRLQLCADTAADRDMWLRWLYGVRDALYGVPPDRLAPVPGRADSGASAPVAAAPVAAGAGRDGAEPRVAEHAVEELIGSVHRKVGRAAAAISGVGCAASSRARRLTRAGGGAGAPGENAATRRGRVAAPLFRGGGWSAVVPHWQW